MFTWSCAQLYSVRPNAGRIEPGESVGVTVQLQPMKEEPPLHVKCRDKFLVQSTTITPDKENMSLAEIVCVVLSSLHYDRLTRMIHFQVESRGR